MQVSPLKGKCIKGKMFFFSPIWKPNFHFCDFFLCFFILKISKPTKKLKEQYRNTIVSLI